MNKHHPWNATTEEVKFIHTPKLSEWEAHLLGNSALVFVPNEGGEPIWFHRWMQYLCFGVVWRKRKPKLRAAPATEGK